MRHWQFLSSGQVNIKVSLSIGDGKTARESILNLMGDEQETSCEEMNLY